MMTVDPADVFQGVILIAAPHFDDEALACGGMVARLPEKERVHLVYAADGARSPIPTFAWQGPPSPDLPQIRMAEARAALDVLGVPQDNAHFLGLPESRLNKHEETLAQRLGELVRQVEPAHVLIPFRYDRHPDHLALHRAMMRALTHASHHPQVTEYFVYYRWQMLPGRDVRRYVRSDRLMQVDIQQQSAQKKRALECYKSQTTHYFSWQDRPILPARRIAEVSSAPELFLRYDPAYPGARILARWRGWVLLVHRVEPTLKTVKDRALALLSLRGHHHADQPA
jgi:LmbE family N-acetylglucosaminyl deacetylase